MFQTRYRFVTHSYSSVLTFCDSFKQATGKDVACNGRLKLRVYGRNRGGGKSLVTDALIAAYSDDHDCLEMAERNRIMEEFSAQARGKTIQKIFNIGGKKSLVTFQSWPIDNTVRPSILGAQKIILPTHRRGIDARVEKTFHPSMWPDVDIYFERKPSDESWDREWEIAVRNPKMQTDKVRKLLENMEKNHPAPPVF